MSTSSKVYIEYNPYRLVTKITVDGEPVKKTSSLSVGEHRLQEWVEKFPENIYKEYGLKKYDITFHGTQMDYEDLEDVIKNAKNNGTLDNETTLTFEKGLEVKDKEDQLKRIIYKIQNGPCEELHKPDMQTAFNNALSKEFRTDVIATMSAGKSTLINALLREKIMPSKQQACTATVTEIHDLDDAIPYAETKDKNGNLLNVIEPVTLEEMKMFNENPAVSRVYGDYDIPFVDPNDISLALVDTLGPNNSRDENHHIETFKALSQSSKVLVLYVLNATQLAMNDDANLLSKVADSMKVGGKQSRDRFIFVLNKLDTYINGEDSVQEALNDAKQYLEDKGINDPNIYPVTALRALEIRTVLKDKKVVGYTENEIDDMDPDIASVITSVKKLNRNEQLHLEKYAPLAPSAKGRLVAELSEAEKLMEDEDPVVRSNGMKQAALIHSGIRPVEIAISAYVNKYARTAKIKNVVDTFYSDLEQSQSFEKSKKEIASNQSKWEEARKNIDEIQKKLNDGAEAQKFKDKIDAVTCNYSKNAQEATKEPRIKAQEKVHNIIKKYKGKEVKAEEARDMIGSLKNDASSIQSELEVTLEELISDQVIKTSNKLLLEYKEKINSLTDELKDNNTLNINPLEYVSGDISDINVDDLLESSTKTESVIVGYDKVKNPEREGFLGFFKFWKPWNIEVPRYEDKKYIDAFSFVTKSLTPIEAEIIKVCGEAVEYSKSQANLVRNKFLDKFDELDKVLGNKLEELKVCTKNAEDAEKILKEAQDKYNWLVEIKNEVDNILAI